MNIEKKGSALQAAFRPYVKFIGILCAGTALVIIFFVLFVRPAAHRITVMRGLLAAKEDAMRQYRAFDAVKNSLDGKRAAINEALQSLAPLLVAGQNKDQSNLSELGKICKEKNIVLERLTPSQEKTETIWRIQFKATYAGTVDFFSTLENHFSITSLSIAGGGTTPVNNVEAVIRPLQIEDAAPETKEKAAGDFIELYKRTDQMLADIKMLSRIDPLLNDVRRNPMFYRDTVFPVDKKGIVIQAPDLPIDSIVWDRDNPLVIIKGRILKTGDNYNDITILSIQENAIAVRYKMHQFTLKYKKRELK